MYEEKEWTERLIFGTVSFFRYFFLHTCPRGPIMAPADNFHACGYCFDSMQNEKTLWQCYKLGYILAMF